MIDYGKDAPFNDPVVRCTECSKVVHRASLSKLGCCDKCGNKRVRNVLVLNEKEMEELAERGVDPDFIKLFKGVEDGT